MPNSQRSVIHLPGNIDPRTGQPIDVPPPERFTEPQPPPYTFQAGYEPPDESILQQIIDAVSGGVAPQNVVPGGRLPSALYQAIRSGRGVN